jgi:hypothetical protein
MLVVEDRSPPWWKYAALGVALVVPLAAAYLRELDWVIEAQPRIGTARTICFAVIVCAVLVFTFASLRYRERGGWAIGGGLLAGAVLFCWGGFWVGVGAVDFFAPGHARSIRVAPDLRVEVYESGWDDVGSVVFLAEGGSARQRRLIAVDACDPDQVVVVGQTLTVCSQRCDLVTRRCQPTP